MQHEVIFPTLPNREELDILCSNLGIDGVIRRLENLKTHPEKPKNPNHIGVKSAAEMREIVGKMEVYEEAMKAYEGLNSQCEIFNLKVDALIHDFICNESGLNKIPEQYQNKVYSKAWSFGHSAGYYEVYLYLLDLVDIFE